MRTGELSLICVVLLCSAPRPIGADVFLSDVGTAKTPPLFMQPAEVPIGVQGQPFHASVDARWSLKEANGSLRHAKVLGEIWRNSSGDVRLTGAVKDDNASTHSQPTITTIFRVADRTRIFWNSGPGDAKSIRLAEFPNAFFENLVVPREFATLRSSLYNCRKEGVECRSSQLGERTIEGISVNGVRYTEVIAGTSQRVPHGLIVTRDVWTDPKIDAVLLIEGADPRYGDFTMRLVNLSTGDQNSELFQPPNDHKLKVITPVPSVPPPVVHLIPNS